MNYSKKEACGMLKKKTNLFVHYADIGEDADKRDYEVSYEKIRKSGYNTTITVDEGIDELMKSFDVLNTENLYSNI